MIKLSLKLDSRSWSSRVHLIRSVVDIYRCAACGPVQPSGGLCSDIFRGVSKCCDEQEGGGGRGRDVSRSLWLRMTPRENEPCSRPWPFAQQTYVQLCRARDAAAALWVLNLHQMKERCLMFCFFFYEQKGILAIVIFVSTLMLVIDHVGSTGAQTTGDNSPRCSGVIMFYCVFKCFLCVFLCLLQHKLHNWEKINKWIVLTWPAKVNTG